MTSKGAVWLVFLLNSVFAMIEFISGGIFHCYLKFCKAFCYLLISLDDSSLHLIKNFVHYQ